MKNGRLKIVSLAALLVSCIALSSHADAPPKAEPRAARSVHLGYSAPEASAFYNELTVRQSAPGSYFMACGFTHGYFGIQELNNGKKLVIFSVWDPPSRKDESVAPEDRAQTMFQAPDVRVKRFGGEGTGGQSFFDYDWKIGETCLFLVKSSVENDVDRKIQQTSYAAWFFLPATGEWKHLVTFKTITRGEQLTGTYSFVEDFRRDYKSATEIRRAEFGNGWVKDLKGDWLPMLRARFTASDAAWEAKDTIDARLTDDPPNAFVLQTGGDTQTHTPLNSVLERPAAAVMPPDVPRD